MKKHLLALTLISALASVLVLPSRTQAAEPAEVKVQHVNVAEATKLIESKKDTVVLDIRTPDEFKDGHIEHAVNVNFLDKSFGEKLDGLDKSKTYLLHCASGARSTRSLDQFKAKGFKDLYHLDGGFHAWEAASKPVKK